MGSLRVLGVGPWRVQDAGWLWLRVRSVCATDSTGRLLLEKSLHLRDGRWCSAFPVAINASVVDVAIELWISASHPPDFLQFVGKMHINWPQWIESNATQWLQIPSCTATAKTETLVGIASATEVLNSAAYVRLSLEPPPPPPSELAPPEPEAGARSEMGSGFRFVLPHRAVRRTRRLRAVRVGEIVHERRTDILHDLLPTTLYGRVDTPRCASSLSLTQREPETGVSKALVLLQLACQYATHCVHQLEQHNLVLNCRCTKLATRTARRKQSQRLLKERRANLQRESQVLSCSLDGLRLLLSQVGPETLAQLQDELVTQSHT